MKKIGIVILLLLLVSCKTSNKIIEDFLLEEMKKNERKNNVLIKDKKSFEKAFHCFVPVDVFNRTTPERKEVYKYLIKKYGGKPQGEWRKKDFKKIGFDLSTEDSIGNYIKKNPKKVNSSNLYYISNPYFYYENGEKHVFFNVHLNKSLHRVTTDFDEVIILKRVKKKWIFVDRIANSDL